MRASLIRLFGAGVLASVSALASGGGAAAQDIWKPRRETPRTERPAPAPTTGRRPPRVRRERVPPVAATRLTVQGRFHKFMEENGLRNLVSSGDTFSPQDKLQFSVKVNQNGYLYVIRQRTADGSGLLLFPSKYHNGGNSYVKEDQEFLLPSNCHDSAAPCWFRLATPEEKLTVIFSRDRIESLPAQAARTDGPAVVPAQTLARLVAASSQQLRRIDGVRVPGVQDDRNTFWVTNTDEKNNGEIIYTLTLKGEGGVKAAAGPAAKN